MTAMMMATQAIAVDGMLPALPTIAAALDLHNANHAQWIVTVYLAGVGCGQLFWGLMSDRYGRRPVLLIGLAVYVIAALLSGFSSSFLNLLCWRFAHGVAAASVVVARSAIRDLYSGRPMARVMSLTFIVFLMVPVIAPSIGQLILQLAPWRSIFVFFALFAAIVLVWVTLRLPETLHPEYRMTLTWAHMLHATALVLRQPTSLFYTLSTTVIFGSVLAYVSMVQQIFENQFHRATLMPTMFALCAASMGVTAYLNSRIVERVGMRVISQAGLLLFIAVTALHVAVAATGLETLWSFVLLQSITMSCVGLTAANFGAMAMEPVGSVAGVGASLQGFLSTFGGAVVGGLIGREFNGSTLPLAIGALLCGLSCLGCVLVAEKGRLFRPHHAGLGAELAAEGSALEHFGTH
jgi:DHA1 family bicyclomycin/chloramphenicol resistance-like MFS transporter